MYKSIVSKINNNAFDLEISCFERLTCATSTYISYISHNVSYAIFMYGYLEVYFPWFRCKAVKCCFTVFNIQNFRVVI